MTMPTPSLRRRVVLAGLAVTATALAIASATVYLVQRHTLLAHLEDVLDERTEIVLRHAADTADAAELAHQLEDRGIRATITAPDGSAYSTDPATPRIGRNLPRPADSRPATLHTRSVELPAGGQATIGVSRDGVDHALGRLLRLELLTAVIALPATALLLDRASRIALRPLRTLVTTANGIAAGDLSRRLTPTHPTTELGTAAAAFDHMLDELETAVTTARTSQRTTREFLDAAAHQLRTPITAANTAAQTLRHLQPKAHDHDLVDVVGDETRRAGDIVDRLLHLARLDQGLHLDPQPTDLDTLLREETDRTSRAAPHIDVALTRLGGPPIALVDRAATSEILANLLDNAVRYARSRVETELDATGSCLKIRLRDDGPGIPLEQTERIFHRFVTLDERSHTGLGLAVARELARAQHGELTYQRDSFELTLPRAHHPHNETSRQPANP